MSQAVYAPTTTHKDYFLWQHLTQIADAIDSLTGLNSGTSAPTTTAPYMLWADTTNGVLKQRNAADDGWVSLWRLGAWGLGLVPSADQTSSFSVDESDGVSMYPIDATSGNITVTLDATLVTAYQPFYLLRVDASGNTVDIDPNEDWIEGGSASKSLSTAGSRMFVFYNGTDWVTL